MIPVNPMEMHLRGNWRSAMVIGYGNPLRADDGLGWRVATELEARRLPSGVEVRKVIQLTPELAAVIAKCELVLFVDAARDGAAGKLTMRRVAAAAEGPSFTHECSPGTLLRAASLLYGATPDAWLLTIAGESFGWGEGLSATVQASLPALLAQVDHLLARDRDGA